MVPEYCWWYYVIIIRQFCFFFCLSAISPGFGPLGDNGEGNPTERRQQ